jgi:hypothetical protein
LPLLVAVPTLLLLFMVGPYSPSVRPGIVVLGAVIGIAAWLMVALQSGGSATPASANRRSYDELRRRIAYAENRLNAARVDDDAPPFKREAWDQANDGLARLTRTLDDQTPSEGWASAESYIAAWAELHLAEEQFLLLVDRPAVIATAQADFDRLDGSEIPRRGVRQRDLKSAIGVLKNAKVPVDSVRDRRQRETIMTIEHAIHEYVDTRYDGLVRLGISLRRYRLLLGIVTYGLFVIAILAAATVAATEIVQSFAAYWLIGAAAGAIEEIWRRRGSTPEVEDYGLSQARYLLVPTLSGSAACAGVYLFALITETTLVELLAANNLQASSLSLGTNLVLPIVAAIFGLAPGRLLGALDRLGESLTDSIDATEATGARLSSDDEGFVEAAEIEVDEESDAQDETSDEQTDVDEEKADEQTGATDEKALDDLIDELSGAPAEDEPETNVNETGADANDPDVDAELDELIEEQAGGKK